MDDRTKNHSSQLTIISEPHKNHEATKNMIEEQSKNNKISSFPDQTKIPRDSKQDVSENSFVQQKLPENMKAFLKNKRIISAIGILKGKSSQNNKNNKKPNRETLQETKESIHQTSMTNLQKKAKDKSHKSRRSSKKDQNRIIHPENLIQCAICQGIIEQKMLNKKIFNCSHKFCNDCTKNYITYKIERFELIYCPNQNCKQVLDTSCKFYQNEVTLKQRKKYKNIQRFYRTNKSDEKMCPMEDCQGVIKIDKSLPSIICNICKSQFCSKCHSKIHEGECANFETSFMIKSLNLVQCQQCKNFIEKAEGCHHITCKCGFQFCERCKQKWKKSHICKYTILNGGEQGWGGCDWGITKKDHMYFLLKIPLKFILVILCTIFWFLFSFLGTPINLVLMLYWLYLLLIKPSIQMTKNENQYWKVILYVLLFPLWMIKNICHGRDYLMDHLDSLLPQIPNSYRCIVRL